MKNVLERRLGDLASIGCWLNRIPVKGGFADSCVTAPGSGNFLIAITIVFIVAVNDSVGWRGSRFIAPYNHIVVEQPLSVFQI